MNIYLSKLSCENFVIAEYSDSIDGYRVTYTRIQPGFRGSIKDTKIARKSPYILEDLSPDSSYEVYIQAKNFYGYGDPSTRIVFRTAKNKIQSVLKDATDFDYDQQGCCARAGVKTECMPMCQYNASLTEIRPLTNLCKEDLGRVTKCASGT